MFSDSTKTRDRRCQSAARRGGASARSGEREARAPAQLVRGCGVAASVGDRRKPEQRRRGRAPGERDEECLACLVSPVLLAPGDHVAIEGAAASASPTASRTCARCAPRMCDHPRRRRRIGNRQGAAELRLRPRRGSRRQGDRTEAGERERGVIREAGALRALERAPVGSGGSRGSPRRSASVASTQCRRDREDVVAVVEANGVGGEGSCRREIASAERPSAPVRPTLRLPSHPRARRTRGGLRRRVRARARAARLAEGRERQHQLTMAVSQARRARPASANRAVPASSAASRSSSSVAR